jgi:hypothetical protein
VGSVAANAAGPFALMRTARRQSKGEGFMEWIAVNWFWILVFIGFIAMHIFGHGGHGSHHGHGGGDRKRIADESENNERQRRDLNASSGGHQH